MTDQPRSPDCTSCPLAAQRKVWGRGALTARVLVLGELPGVGDVARGEPFVDWAGGRVGALLRTNGLAWSDVRAENTIQCHAKAGSAQATSAAAHCGPSLAHVLARMPALELVLAFGDLALREVSGWRESTAALRAHTVERKRAARAAVTTERRFVKQAFKYMERDLPRWRKALARWQDRRKRALARPTLKASVRALALAPPARPPAPRAPTPQVTPQVTPEVRGWKSVTTMRGSWLALPGVGAGGAHLMPLIHPATAHPARQPRLWPVISLDTRKAVRLWRGDQTMPAVDWAIAPNADALEFALDAWRRDANRAGAPLDLALDIEWSRVTSTLAGVGIGGPGGRYVLLPTWTAEGDGAMQRDWWPAAFRVLQSAFDDPCFAWGGHYICYDADKLATIGLRMRPAWCSLYAFHLCFSELGSARDEESEADDFSQATGYDLGFVGSLLTPFAYAKDFWSTYNDVLEAPTPIWAEYCVGDVARSYHAWLVMRDEITRMFAPAPERGFALLRKKMAVAHVAAEMTRRGVPINDALRRERLADWTARYEAAQAEARALVGADFNMGSTAQLARALEAQGVRGIRWNHATGKPSLDGNAIVRLMRAYPLNPLLGIRQRVAEAQKEVAHYVALAPQANGRARPRWKVHGTSTGRWSSSPNLQNQTNEQRMVIG